MYPHQLLSLQVDETIIQVQVLTEERDTDVDPHGSTCASGNIWEHEGSHSDPEGGQSRPLSNEHVNFRSGNPCCWKLVADTELTVLPPPPRLRSSNISCRLYPSKLDNPCIPSLPTVSQGCVLIHPQQLEALREAIASDQFGLSPMYVRATKSLSTGQSNVSSNELPIATSRIFRIETSDQVPKGWIGESISLSLC